MYSIAIVQARKRYLVASTSDVYVPESQVIQYLGPELPCCFITFRYLRPTPSSKASHIPVNTKPAPVTLLIRSDPPPVSSGQLSPHLSMLL